PNEGNVRLLRAKVQRGEMSEAEATAMLGKSPLEAQGKIPDAIPTPTVQDGKNNAGPSQHHRNTPPLNTWAVQNPWPTPQHHDAHQGQAKRVGRFGTKHGGRNLNDE